MTPPSRLYRRPRSFGLALAVAVSTTLATSPAHAAAEIPYVESVTVAEFSGLAPSDNAAFDDLARGFLRADGSFAGLPRGPYANEAATSPSLLRFGGPLPRGVVDRQPLSLWVKQPYSAEPVSGVGGYDWVADEPDPRPALPGEDGDVNDIVQPPSALVAIDDRGRIVRRTELLPRTNPTTTGLLRLERLVPTGIGLRLIVNNEVWRPNGRRLAAVPQLSGVFSAVGRPDGSVLLSGWESRKFPKWSNVVVRVSPRGVTERVRKRGTSTFVSGQPLANVRGGTLVGDRDGDYRLLDVALLTDGRRLRPADLDFDALPWSEECRARKEAFSVSWVTAGATGHAVLGVECVRYADRGDLVLQALTVGLDHELRLRWYGAGGVKPVVGADGRLFSLQPMSGHPTATYRLVALREPGAEPRTGRVVSARRSGKGAVVSIRCRATEGSVCSGKVRLRGSRGGSKTLPYALRGRPGVAGALIRRYFETAPRGALRATLGR